MTSIMAVLLAYMVGSLATSLLVARTIRCADDAERTRSSARLDV
jgi:glycerol-3-phosphate acyltransferase PlsY